MNERENRVCFSGHRTYIGSVQENERLRESLREAYEAGFRGFISGMAEGFDLAAAELLIEMRSELPDIRLEAFVPFGGQADKFRPDEKLRYERVLGAADSRRLLSENYYPGCFLARNDRMVEASSALICYFDGRRGGTRYTVKRALRSGLRVTNIYRSPDSLNF
jgi:uncharacterized phage-like protein YoqJ